MYPLKCYIENGSSDVWLLNRAGAVVAKYGDKSVYFDLEDLGNTTGQWDVYGSDAPSPYNSLQVCMSNYTSKVRKHTK